MNIYRHGFEFWVTCLCKSSVLLFKSNHYTNCSKKLASITNFILRGICLFSVYYYLSNKTKLTHSLNVIIIIFKRIIVKYRKKVSSECYLPATNVCAIFLFEKLPFISLLLQNPFLICLSFKKSSKYKPLLKSLKFPVW